MIVRYILIIMFCKHFIIFYEYDRMPNNLSRVPKLNIKKSIIKSNKRIGIKCASLTIRFQINNMY